MTPTLKPNTHNYGNIKRKHKSRSWAGREARQVTAQPLAFVSVEGCVEAAWPALATAAEPTPSVVDGIMNCIPPNPAAAAAIVAGSFAKFNGVMTAVGFDAVPGAAEEAAAAAATGAAAIAPSFRGAGGRAWVWFWK